ncbi:hypothetical protein SDC9_148236 [bioreactor metagenome]|uniref:Uncharacterized protein n=1 Tax=bioreactor metagenome TaxID=1076179 RepID=A0A645EHW4_9ZZZZ
MDDAGYGQPVFGRGIMNRMPAAQYAAGLLNFFRTAAEDFPQDCQIHPLGKGNDIHGGQNPAAHGPDIRQRIRRGNLAKQIRIADHGRKKIQRLDQRGFII